MTVEEVLEYLTRPAGKIENTVDTLKTGTPDMEVTGIAVAFTATHRVVRQALARKANLLIVHEGAFYSHWDSDDIEHHPVHAEKWRLIRDAGLAVYRFHDHWHRYRPDGITQGLIQALGWESCVTENQATAAILTMPAMTVGDIAEEVKQKLGIGFVRVAGRLSMPCRRIGLLVGYRGGGALAIPLFEKENLDLILYGEGPEWETPEYVRDAVYQGRRRALIALGHAESEEPGMRHLADRMSEAFPGIPVHFIAENHVFHIV